MQVAGVPPPILFYVNCYRLRRGLHSFPTRRSSDLGRQEQETQSCGCQRGVLQILGLGLLVPVEQQDRKSTRLNSSHVSISYAVFCLKKKNRESVERCLEQYRPQFVNAIYCGTTSAG